jgi:Ni,Fe-hydrogenase III component G
VRRDVSSKTGCKLIVKKSIREMVKELIIEKFKKTFNSDILEIVEKNQRRVTITIKPGSILNAAKWLYTVAEFRFIIATALHTKRGFEIHYHFSMDSIGLILNIHIILNKDYPEIESLSNMFSASNWIEREMHELFGINFLNHPNQDKLISEGNWADGVYPYRKEFKSDREEKR